MDRFDDGEFWRAVQLVVGSTERPSQLTPYRLCLLGLLILEARLHRAMPPLVEALQGTEWLDPLLMKLNRASLISADSSANKLPQIHTRQLLMQAGNDNAFAWDEYQAELKPFLTVSDRLQVACELAAYANDLNERELVESVSQFDQINGRAAVWLFMIVNCTPGLDYLVDDCRKLRQRFWGHPALVQTWFEAGDRGECLDCTEEEVVHAVLKARIHFGLVWHSRVFFFRKLKPRKALRCFLSTLKPIANTQLYCEGKGALKA